MSFEELLRLKVAAAKTPGAKNILKLVLGEFQVKNAAGKGTPQDVYNYVEKIIKGNEETLRFLKEGDARIAVLNEQTEVVKQLLPPYLTKEQILEKIAADAKLTADINDLFSKGVGNLPATENVNSVLIGRATGLVSKVFKAENLEFKGETVREALIKLFEG